MHKDKSKHGIDYNSNSAVDEEYPIILKRYLIEEISQINHDKQR